MRWKNNLDDWGWTSIVIHWVTALAVLALFVLGLWMVDLTYYDDWYRQAPYIHKSIGVLLLLLTLFRLVWYYSNPRPESLGSYSDIERNAAKWVHGLMYLFMLSVMLSGYFISTADGRSIDVFGWFEMPALDLAIENQEDLAGDIHFVLSVILISMVVVHAAAAMKHHWIDKDPTLKRMLGIRS
ncbi:MAG: cytochrome b [Gammaproteobacteria bacterium]